MQEIELQYLFLGFFLKNLPDVTGNKPLYGNLYFGLIPESRDHND